MVTIHMHPLHLVQEMFNDDAFAKIKKGARIVNVARGGVIDDAALARALDSGAVAQARADHHGRLRSLFAERLLAACKWKRVSYTWLSAGFHGP